MPDSPTPRTLRLWPLIVILVGTIIAITLVRHPEDVAFQAKNLSTAKYLLGSTGLTLVWWLGFSRVPWKTRFLGLAIAFASLGAFLLVFRIRGVSGDLVPILENRWRSAAVSESKASLPSPAPAPVTPVVVSRPRSDFPQFLGPTRNGVLPGINLSTHWASQPPSILWRKPMGAGWSGFVVVGDRAITQEQSGDEERVTCYRVSNGELLWSHSNPAHYANTIAGEGPRATPTIAGGRVYALGSTGFFNCLSLTDGKPFWTREVLKEAESGVPEWGVSASPLVVDDRVYLLAGNTADQSVRCYSAISGELLWKSGNSAASYSSAFLVELSGVRQIIAFNAKRISSHDPQSGQKLWDYPWGVNFPQVAAPVQIGPSQILFSSGYGVGSELLEFKSSGSPPTASVQRIWKSTRMKAKFANLVARDGFLYGLDDGMMACLDLKDGSQRWKEGRYGHGQSLWVGDLYLLMAESGELVMLRPTPEAAHEIQRLAVFKSKTWNPIALAGSLAFLRNDQEAVCLDLAAPLAAK